MRFLAKKPEIPPVADALKPTEIYMALKLKHFSSTRACRLLFVFNESRS